MQNLSITFISAPVRETADIDWMRPRPSQENRHLKVNMNSGGIIQESAGSKQVSTWPKGFVPIQLNRRYSL